MTSAPSPATVAPAVEPAEPAVSAATAAKDDSQPVPLRRSILSTTDPSVAAKRLSTASNISNPAREAPPTPDSVPPTSNPASPPGSATSHPASVSPRSSPNPNPPTGTTRHKIPSFPPPQASRISIMSISSSRDSFHPQFASSLPYSSVRDFAYPSLHPLHYGPPLSSGMNTPSSYRGSGYFESGSGGGWFTGARRLSDPSPPPSFDERPWVDVSYPSARHPNQPPPLNFSDGPPWSEDEDLQSPVVLPKQPGAGHRKHKSTNAHLQTPHSRAHSKNAFTPTTLQHYPGGSAGRDSAADADAAREQVRLSSGEYYTRNTALGDGEPGGEFLRHPDDDSYDPDHPGYYHEYSDDDDEIHEYDDDDEYNSRFSRDYQFTIASPDEEMHGKAVALFDFTRENENELPLVEGQVVWVSYRHGMGWLVAEDPKTGESGLVPEEYVRLFRDMQSSRSPSPYPPSPGLLSPTGFSAPPSQSTEMNPSALSAEHTAPIISTFSTSSQDLNPYPYQLPKGNGGGRGGDGLGTPTAVSHKERIEQIRREQERAIRDEAMADTPRLGSGRFMEVNGRGDDEGEEEGDVEGEAGEGSSGVSSSDPLPAVAANVGVGEEATGTEDGREESTDAADAQGIDLREKGKAAKPEGEKAVVPSATDKKADKTKKAKQ